MYLLGYIQNCCNKKTPKNSSSNKIEFYSTSYYSPQVRWYGAGRTNCVVSMSVSKQASPVTIFISIASKKGKG